MSYDWEFDEEDNCYHEIRKTSSYRRTMAKYIYKNPGVHVPNKNEAKTLRKLMSKTGLTEEEIRLEKKYRVMLADARIKGTLKNTDTKQHKRLKRLLKVTTRKLKLPKEHPDTIKAFLEIIKYEQKKSFLTPLSKTKDYTTEALELLKG